ncbi:glycosyltransferase family 39 protein [Candidatus Gottesmanbacteria bacterium]|nr:glycosyltransferase family 39 protein [Candidatus Gottesmanbacteria bacterium]
MIHGRKEWFVAAIVLVFLIVSYLGLRLFNLAGLPIFTDEAIYIRWAQIGSRDAAWRFISLVDGKQPLFTWLMMGTLRLVRDPLLAGRLVSVGSGVGTMIGVGLVTWELFKNKRMASLASLLYIFCPFSLIYDRMALYDSLVAAFSVWNLYLGILLVRHVRLDIALLWGMTLGLGMLNKTSGFLSLYLSPFLLILFDWQLRNKWRRLLSWLVLVFVAAVISQALYGVLRLSPLFTMIGQKDVVFIYSIREWLAHPIQFFTGNTKGLVDWVVNYLTRPVFLLAMGPLFALWEKRREKVLLYVWWLAPFIALALFGRVLYPRFILFMILPLLILASVSLNWIIERLRRTVLLPVVFILLFFPSILTDYFIVTNPLYAQIPRSDKGQYIDDWPSGWGVKEVNALLYDQSKRGKVSVYTEGTFGLLPYAIEIYLVDNPNVEIVGIWPLPPEIPKEALEDAKDHQVFIVFNQTQVVPHGWPVELVSEYQKGNRKDRKLRLFRVVP